MFKLKFICKCIQNDLDKLPDEVFLEVDQYFEKFKTDPYKYTQELGNLHGIDLRGYRKTYVYNHKYRIISKIIDDTVHIVEIIAVDKRDDLLVYKKAFDRIIKLLKEKTTH